MSKRTQYGSRAAGSARMTLAERRALARAGLLYEARVYLLRAAPQCAQARRLADALAALVDHLWPTTDAETRRRAR